MSECMGTRWQEGGITDITGTGYFRGFLSFSFVCLFVLVPMLSTARPKGKMHSSVHNRTIGDEARAGPGGRQGLASRDVTEER